GWNNPPVRWFDIERTLSGRPKPPEQGDGSDSPAWTKRREGYFRPDDLEDLRGADQAGGDVRVPYAELHCHSNFSFLDGASHPEELVEEAARLGLDAVALTDHDGMYGVVRFFQAAAELGVRTVYGAELSLGLSAPQNDRGVGPRRGGRGRQSEDPEGSHLLLLARNERGYAALCRAITEGQLAGHEGGEVRAEKGKPVYRIADIAEQVAGDCVVLTGCRKGPVRSALATADADGYRAAAEQLRSLTGRFGQDNVFVELFDHGLPSDSRNNDAMATLAAEFGLPTVATNVAHYAAPHRGRLAATVAAIRGRRSLDEMDGWLPPAAGAHLRSGAEMRARFARYPDAVQRAALLGVECAFDLALVAPELPPFDVPRGHTEASWLRQLTYESAFELYGSRYANEASYRQLERELKIIIDLNFPGYFLIVADIVRFCRDNDILCQGRGSAANSAVCYALGITKVDPVRWKLLFERFLAPERDGLPDIDVDIESDRREEVIQYVYAKHGRLRAAQVANVITYRARSAVRDVAKALGYSPGQQDAWSKQIDRWSGLAVDGSDPGHDIPAPVITLANELGDFPRHLGIHSGGMVLADRPVSEVCPVEWGRMAGRSVLQWDKDDCAAAGLIKFDLLGLGMLSAIHYAVDLVRDHEGIAIDLAQLDLDDANVYDMLCRADAIGVFQVESRAQLATLPRLKPRSLYDLAVEVALIRPGPIQGGSVHPYIRRHNKSEPVVYDHPLTEKALKKTHGVPLFQEQLMQLAVDVANFSPGEADELRRAMGAKRSTRKMERLRQRFYAGAAGNGVDEAAAERIYEKLLAFANFGFPESHALSFAYLVFASAYLKHYHPAAFCAALLRAQPMGFYSPQSLVADARRHGVTVRGACINASLAHATLEPVSETESGLAVRIGLASVRTLGQELAEGIVEERLRGGAFGSMTDLARRVRLRTPQVEALATAGAFGCFEPDRRKALWAAGAVAQERPEKLPGSGVGVSAPALPGMDGAELVMADVWATGLSPDSFPTQFLRARLDRLGVVPAERLVKVPEGTRVLIGGAVTHRQRPATAGGVTFLNIEDETGMVNVICSPGLWARYRRVARSSPALLIRGVVEHAEHGSGVVSVLADRLQHLDVRIPHKSRDFR
ncbi:MAG: DNA polymerase III subunit alpha, partial [Actinophytocola sp.]|nr:DNA polymerase III subunit alpha [Actinophytocola sp.]